MRAYVNEKGVPPCKVSQPDKHCSAKEQEYIQSWSSKDAAAVTAERARLEKLLDAKGLRLMCRVPHLVSYFTFCRRQSRRHPLGAAAPRAAEAVRIQTAGSLNASSSSIHSPHLQRAASSSMTLRRETPKQCRLS